MEWEKSSKVKELRRKRWNGEHEGKVDGGMKGRKGGRGMREGLRTIERQGRAERKH